jgi:hypothetical protein
VQLSHQHVTRLVSAVDTAGVDVDPELLELFH